MGATIRGGATRWSAVVRGRFSRRPLHIAAVLAIIAPMATFALVMAPRAVAAGDGLNARIFNFPATEVTTGVTRTEVGRSACVTGTLTNPTVDWGTGVPTVSGNSGTCLADDFMVHATGYLTIPGTYDGSTLTMTFESASDDGTYLALTDPTNSASTTVIDNWVVQSSAFPSFNASGQMVVKAGLTYDVDLWLFDHQGGASFNLFWHDGPTPVVLPQSALSTVRPLTAQPPLTIGIATGSPTSLTYVNTSVSTQLSTTGGDGIGAVSYAKVSGNCTVSTTGLLTATGTGACVATATKASDAVFAAKTSSAFTLTVLAAQSPLSVSTPASLAYGAAATVTTSGGSGTGAISLNVTGTCSATGMSVTATGVGTCTVTATKGADGVYDVASATASFATVKAVQAPLSISLAGTLNYDPTTPATANVALTGGSGSGTVSYVASGPCTLSSQSASGAVVTATGGGTCSVTVSKATDTNYLAATAFTSFSIGTATQAPLNVTVGSLAMTYRATPAATTSVSTSGGSGSGAISYLVSPTSSSVCSIVSAADGLGTLTALSAGTCTFTAVKAADNDFSVAASTPTSVTVYAAVTTSVVTASLDLTYGVAMTATAPVVAYGGYGVTYSATLPAGLAINASTGVISGTPSAAGLPTNFSVTATDLNGSTSTSTIVISVLKAAPSIAWVTQPAATAAYGSVSVLAVATSNAGGVTYSSITPATCDVQAATGVFTLLRAGTCNYRATVAESANFVTSTLTGSLAIELVAPSAPTGLSLRVSNTALTASWDVPVDDGGSALSTYTVRATARGLTSTCTTSAPATSCTVTDLVDGQAYDVTVTATNTAVGIDPAQTSPASARKSAFIPNAVVRFVSGNINDRYDPTPVTTGLSPLPADDQQSLLDSGIVVAPDVAPVVTITANLSQTTSGSEVSLTIPQTVDSGTDVHVRLLPPSDTPLGSVVRALLRLPSGRSISLGSTTLSSADLAGIQLTSFAMVTPGDYVLSVDIIPAATAAPVRLALSSGGQSIDYAIKVVPGKAGVPIIADAPSPTPTPTPSETPTPEPTPSDTPTPEPSPSVTTDDRGLEVIDPLDSPTEVAKTAVTAVTLVSAVSAAASAAAAVGAAAGSAASAAGGAASGASGAGGGARAGGGGSTGGAGGSSGGGSGSSGSSGGSSSSGGGSNTDSGGDTDGADSMASVQTVDVEHEVFEDLTLNWGDALPIWGVAGMKYLDRKSHNATVALAPISPLLSKLINDGAYTRALVGAFSGLLPIASTILAVLGILANDNLLLPPPYPLLLGIVIIGVLDAAAGALGIGIFIAGMWLTAGVHSQGDLRMMMGLMIVGFGPALLAGAFRGYRRPAAMSAPQWWERVVDVTVAPFIGGWATKGMIDALSALAGVKLPIGDHANSIAIAVAITLAVRVVFEEFAAQYFPSRLNEIHPTEVRTPSNLQKSIALAMRAGIFFFVADAFVGTGWYLYVGTALFILPNYVGLFQDRFPNYPALYQLLPAGLPGLAASLLVASATLGALTQALGETPDLAKFAFAVLPIPSAILAIMGMLGREPRADDVRWYQRPQFTWLYRIGGPVVLVYTMHLAGIY